MPMWGWDITKPRYYTTAFNTITMHTFINKERSSQTTTFDAYFTTPYCNTCGWHNQNQLWVIFEMEIKYKGINKNTKNKNRDRRIGIKWIN